MATLSLLWAQEKQQLPLLITSLALGTALYFILYVAVLQ